MRFFNYKFQQMQINTPILEYSNVFERSLGEGTDILTKELYKFPDKSNHMVTLRPEGTASK
jgi:histidyl-tRNA synthetase